MRLDLDTKEIEKIENLITNRIEELRYDISDKMEYSEDELREIIREYKALLKKINKQIDNIAVLK